MLISRNDGMIQKSLAVHGRSQHALVNVTKYWTCREAAYGPWGLHVFLARDTQAMWNYLNYCKYDISGFGTQVWTNKLVEI